MLRDIARAIGQLGDPRFRRVLLLGLGLTLGLLVAMVAGTIWLVSWLLPETLTLPVIGVVALPAGLAAGVSGVGILVLSSFLMVPVASAFIGLFLDEIAEAVEARHYPRQRGSAPSFLAGLADAGRFLGIVLVANLLAVGLYVLFAPFAPLIFWALNSFLLGREYFQLVALRHRSPPEAKRLRRRHAGQIWLAGGLVAVPLTVPVVNLIVPIIGAASFTHFYHRVTSAAAAR